MKHTLGTIKQKIRDCDVGKCQLVDVLVEVNETEKELRERMIGAFHRKDYVKLFNEISGE